MKNNFFQTPSKPGVLQLKTFSHTPDEARTVGLAKACVFQKIYSVIEKLDPRKFGNVYYGTSNSLLHCKPLRQDVFKHLSLEIKI